MDAMAASRSSRSSRTLRSRTASSLQSQRVTQRIMAVQPAQSNASLSLPDCQRAATALLTLSASWQRLLSADQQSGKDFVVLLFP